MQTAGHQEVHGETIAKFEFFENGWMPYSQYLDVDKVDLILRRKKEAKAVYREVQVKFGRLYPCGPQWENALFDVTSWRFFDPDTFIEHRPDLFVAYVLSNPEMGYQGDIFIFQSEAFHGLIQRAILTGSKKGGEKRKMYLSRARSDGHWYLRYQPKFNALTSESVLSIQSFRRNFDILV